MHTIYHVLNQKAYDPMGNRSRFEDRSHPAVTYTANPLNQYTAVSAFNTPPAYDPDGNLTRRNDRALTWNAENRLLRDEPAFPNADDQRVRYAYDPIGRRVRRSVDTFDGTSWSTTSDTHYSYWNWNVIEEHHSQNNETRRYVWGEDLSGSLQGAGGVGGLIASEANGSHHFYHYDGNGNVTELTNGNGTTVASYRYTAFGQLRSSSGPAAEANEYRFSTKPYDDVSGTYYYGFRYYDPGLGRWLNRDPIGEDGGVNVYAFVGNDGVNKWDFFGYTSNCSNTSNKSFSFSFETCRQRCIKAIVIASGDVEVEQYEDVDCNCRYRIANVHHDELRTSHQLSITCCFNMEYYKASYRWLDGRTITVTADWDPRLTLDAETGTISIENNRPSNVRIKID